MNPEKKDLTTLKEMPYIIVKGFLMGSADIVPGVSGGTLALILGIYERLLDAIKSVNGRFVKLLLRFRLKEAAAQLHLKFLLTLLTGIFCAFAFFTRVVPLQTYMFTHPEAVFGLFFGLIIGSVVILIKEIKNFGVFEFIMLCLGILFGIWVVTLVPASTPEHPAFIFLSGAIAITAMILPGISGSYILLILQKYDYMLSQLGKLGGPETAAALFVIIPFILGAAAGIILFSRVLSWLLNKYHTPTLVVLIGFLIGSLYVIWPYQHRDYLEAVSHTEELPANDVLVLELLSAGPRTNLPEYKRLAAEDVLRDGLPAGEMVTVETVKRKLISSEPYLPGSTGEKAGEDPDVGSGVMGILAGLVLVGGLDWLRKRGADTEETA